MGAAREEFLRRSLVAGVASGVVISLTALTVGAAPAMAKPDGGDSDVIVTTTVQAPSSSGGSSSGGSESRGSESGSGQGQNGQGRGGRDEAPKATPAAPEVTAEAPAAPPQTQAPVATPEAPAVTAAPEPAAERAPEPVVVTPRRTAAPEPAAPENVVAEPK